MMDRTVLRKADVVVAGVLILLGLTVIASALCMPMSGTHGGVEVTWYLSPATFPLLVGALIVSFSVAVMVRAIRAGGLDGFREFALDVAKKARHDPSTRRGALIGLLVVGYVLFLRLHPFGWMSRGLVRLTVMRNSITRFLLEPSGVNYVLSSALFLSAFMFLFHTSSGSPRKRAAFIVCLSLVTSLATGYVFREQLLVPLP